MPSPPALRIIRPAGRVPRFNPGNASMLGWAGETTSLSPILAAEKDVIRHHLGDVISQSFGVAEQAVGSTAIRSLRSAYTAAYASHVTMLAASGDTGVTGFEPSQRSYYTHRVTSWPASDPLVTAVGGTRLHLDAGGSRDSADTVWNDTYSHTANQLVNGNDGPNPLGTGGGESVAFTRPSYQGNVAAITGGRRGVPDISMSAACSGAVNVYQSFAGQPAGWYAVCGTSESSPLLAGIVALADQVAGHRLGLINPALYRRPGPLQPGHRPGHDQRRALRARTGPRRPLAVPAAAFSKMAGVRDLSLTMVVSSLFVTMPPA